jgi:hypothetical protein
MAVTTKNVVGNVNNLLDGDITGLTILFDLVPQWVIVDNTIIVGVQTGGVKGEPVTPDPSTGAFSVDIVAVDYVTPDAAPWSINVTITGPTVENPIVIPIAPPKMAGSGDVDFATLVIPAAIPGNPVVIVGPGSGGVDTVNGYSGPDINLSSADTGSLPFVTLATVATSGSYTDLSSKPTIPTTASQVGAVAGSGKITVSTTAPTSPSINDVWVDVL